MKYEEYSNTITATELKQNLGKYLDYAIDDHEIVITKNGKKAARLSPYITEIERYMTVKEEAVDYQYGGMKVSYEEFMEIYEKSELRMEFINGEIIIMGSPNTFHQEISGNVFVILAESKERVEVLCHRADVFDVRILGFITPTADGKPDHFLQDQIGFYGADIALGITIRECLPDRGALGEPNTGGAVGVRENDGATLCPDLELVGDIGGDAHVAGVRPDERAVVRSRGAIARRQGMCTRCRIS